MSFSFPKQAGSPASHMASSGAPPPTPPASLWLFVDDAIPFNNVLLHVPAMLWRCCSIFRAKLHDPKNFINWRFAPHYLRLGIMECSPRRLDQLISTLHPLSATGSLYLHYQFYSIEMNPLSSTLDPFLNLCISIWKGPPSTSSSMHGAQISSMVRISSIQHEES